MKAIAAERIGLMRIAPKLSAAARSGRCGSGGRQRNPDGRFRVGSALSARTAPCSSVTPSTRPLNIDRIALAGAIAAAMIRSRRASDDALTHGLLPFVSYSATSPLGDGAVDVDLEEIGNHFGDQAFQSELARDEFLGHLRALRLARLATRCMNEFRTAIVAVATTTALSLFSQLFLRFPRAAYCRRARLHDQEGARVTFSSRSRISCGLVS